MKHRPAITVTCCFASGICSEHFIPVPFGIAIALCIALTTFSLLAHRLERVVSVVMIFLLILSGALYAQSRRIVEQDHVKHIARFYRGKPITVRGKVNTSVRKTHIGERAKYSFTLKVEEVLAPWGWERRRGSVLINMFRDHRLSYGDYIQTEGKIHQPFDFSDKDNFSYREYLNKQGIYHILSIKKATPVLILNDGGVRSLKRLSHNIRGRLGVVFDRYLSRNESGLMRAIILGDRASIPKQVRELFVQTGTAHILAISGLHVGVVAGLFFLFAKAAPVGNRMRSVLVMVLLVGYAFLTGGRPSVVRATVMSCVFLMSLIAGKERDLLNTLCVSAFLILLYNPMNLFDIGFQLSFTCVLSIIGFNHYVNRLGWGKGIKPADIVFEKFIHLSKNSLGVSAAVWLGVAGLIAYYFGIATPITVVANLFVVPMISVIVTLGFGLLVTGVFLPVWAPLFAACLSTALNVMVAAVFLMEKAPGAHFTIRDVKIWHVIVYYIVCALALYAIYRARIDKHLRV